MEIGKHSRKLLQLRKALHQGTLTADGLLPIEGPILLQEALRSGLEVVDVFLRTGAIVPPGVAANLYEVPPDVFKTIHETEHSQGIVATVRPREFTLADVVGGTSALVVVMCRLQDPGNVGTILRVSEAFGATGCVALHGTAAFYNAKVVRASTGSLFRLPHVGGIDLDETIEALRGKGIRIAGTAPDSETSIENWNWRESTAVLIGNEGSGLSRDELSQCDSLLRIPHQPSVESLNSAVATAVILYEASRSRR
jgi:RNA methyltransferase, TrmH family